MATTDQYVATVWQRISQGKPQPQVGVWRSAIQSTINAAMQRTAGRVAGDVGLHPLLMHEWSITLGAAGTAGQDPINNLSPVLLLSEAARRWWRVTMTGIRFPLKYRPNITTIENPPPIPDLDYMYYTFFNQNIVVRDFQGNVPTQVDLQLFGNKVPAISDPAFDGELFDDLIDIGVAIILESNDLREVVRQAEQASTTATKEEA